ncbi:NAD(P)H-dependent glycerol-3-phosphate dehydrogenase [Thalassotalea sp. G20_0]|uniref:NAD(P)H-dependent glycerol-3-phosphate dehydrogenase n=1 Tax=Thalassotalea sp. G20_0 TaxID=2821093 RepID=UPI001ADD1F37|nr:NAD(P)H-dependent glycerol-3-phosphate dehydrogenase [Thalassotalea sp. G20_0]MBO9496518.1 NAD(P)H-dependent glycerol-3-phosphate dehydrogenase [Thalassotalea sp. G20_0]
MTERPHGTAENGGTGEYTIAVLGGGSFGTALADISATNGHRVKLWMRDAEQVRSINDDHVNARYLPEFRIHPSVSASTDLSAVVADADIVFIAIPSKSFREVVRKTNGLLCGKIVISTTKGIEPVTFDLMSQILMEELENPRIGVLSGPNLAGEIVAKALTATVIASDDEDLCQIIQSVLHCDYFRVYSNTDVYGVELAGALKNIYAIVSGMGAALGMGENTQSMLITRSLAEMSRFAVTLGANPMTFLGLAGVGDLVATCTSDLSRNFRVGYALGQGCSLDQAEARLGQVAEGVNTLKQVKQKADQLGVYMPLVDGLYSIIFEGNAIGALVKGMMLREQKTDVEFMSTQ